MCFPLRHLKQHFTANKFNSFLNTLLHKFFTSCQPLTATTQITFQDFFHLHLVVQCNGCHVRSFPASFSFAGEGFSTNTELATRLRSVRNAERSINFALCPDRRSTQRSIRPNYALYPRVVCSQFPLTHAWNQDLKLGQYARGRHNTFPSDLQVISIFHRHHHPPLEHFLIALHNIAQFHADVHIHQIRCPMPNEN